MEVNINHSLSKDAKNKKRHTMKTKMFSGSTTTKSREQQVGSKIFTEIALKNDTGAKTPSRKQTLYKKKPPMIGTGSGVYSTLSYRLSNEDQAMQQQ